MNPQGFSAVLTYDHTRLFRRLYSHEVNAIRNYEMPRKPVLLKPECNHPSSCIVLPSHILANAHLFA